MGLVLALGYAGWEYRLYLRAKKGERPEVSDHVPAAPEREARVDDQPLDYLDHHGF